MKKGASLYSFGFSFFLVLVLSFIPSIGMRTEGKYRFFEE
ncbi:hypothetical protein JOD43_003561 [Pullulanibacillus pueri]|uniref:Uncharacterized protein n=1 Tax=Pullulanibacillus pueri TaxID=1437324 RepID=A0A8J2ZYA9_9BACL|nr:hypothetical protein [Pullulanibacillus pueri]GGH86539.1 hypothetical protein GCM10007096_34480 [Pullulanibacillus pueri]